MQQFPVGLQDSNQTVLHLASGNMADATNLDLPHQQKIQEDVEGEGEGEQQSNRFNAGPGHTLPEYLQKRKISSEERTNETVLNK